MSSSRPRAFRDAERGGERRSRPDEVQRSGGLDDIPGADQIDGRPHPPQRPGGAPGPPSSRPASRRRRR